MQEKELIAETIIYAIDKNDRGFEIHLMVGKPYQDGNDWGCPVAMLGLHGVFPDMYGVDSWQALQTAQLLQRRLLNNFVEDGGKLYHEKGGDELTVDELFGEIRETPVRDQDPTSEQQARIHLLTDEELRIVDAAILANVSTQWRKVARVIGSAMNDNKDQVRGIPDVFYGERLKKLAEQGHLESQGDLDHMRFSEVRVPTADRGDQ